MDRREDNYKSAVTIAVYDMNYSLHKYSVKIWNV